MEQRNKHKDDAVNLRDDARSVMSATGTLARNAVTKAGQTIAATKGVSKTIKTAKTADQAIRSKPYQAVCIAFGLGALFGFIMGRRR
jgi:ElaB/YqjD/DUF883 family membrane-anchored ribosome-binding protein